MSAEIKKDNVGSNVASAVSSGSSAVAALVMPPKATALSMPAVERQKRDFYISYDTSGMRSGKALFEKLTQDFQPPAAMALSEAVDYKLAQVVMSVFNEPSVIQANRNRTELEAMLILVTSHPLVTHGMFAIEAALGPREDLPYHGANHTWRVLRDALAFAIADGCSAREVLLVGIAAVFHDIGYVESKKQNEPIGAAYVRNAMETYTKMSLRGGHFSESEVALVEQMILDTALKFDAEGLHPAKPSTPLSQYLLDADVSNFGTQEFFSDTIGVFQENVGDPEVRNFADLPKSPAGNRYLKTTHQLLRRHHWLSKTAERVLGKGKSANVVRVENAIV
jgi:hypothetical protein